MAGFFSRLKGKDGPTTLTKSKKGQQAASQVLPAKPKWSDAWTRTSVEAEEVQELLKGCTIELKSRALDVPFFLLPFRPTSDPSAARTFIRNYFDGKQALQGDDLLQELRLTEPMVLCSVVKWCWSRLAGGVVTWDSYEMFRIGELDSEMARDSFTAFIPVGADSDARSKIIFDFFDLLAAVAAHGKKNGLGGRKLSRLAGWWAFDHGNKGEGFDGGYKGWSAAADATSHLFFAYLRSMSPESVKGVNGISTLPISLQKLVQETEYPPMTPTLMLYSTPKVAMIVESVSPTPFALLRRANNFVYRDEDHALQDFSNYDDPVKALSDECRRVLRSISSSNQTQVSNSKNSTGLKDASWSRFEDIGFSGAFDEAEEDQEDQTFGAKRRENAQSLRSAPHSKTMDMGRPTTPSWADFLSSGFVDEKMNNPTPLLLPPDKILPPIETSRGRSSQSHRPRLESDRTLEPGELASITKFDLDDSFWWVWISSLAGEETAERKAAFGRCALVETVIPHGKWLVIEEQVKGAAPAPEAGAYLAEKKSRFGWTKRGKGVSRSKSSTAKTEDKATLHPPFGTAQSTGSRTNIGPDQYARIQATAVQLQQKQRQQAAEQEIQARRGRGESDSGGHMKTNSVLTMQPAVMTELSPAMKWARKYDKDAVREAYLTNDSTGKGAQTNGNGHVSQTNGAAAERDLPAIPPTEKTAAQDTITPAALPPTPPKENAQMSNLAAEKAAEVGLPVDAHPAERARPTTPPLKRNPASQSHLITPPKKTQQQSLAQFLETTETGNGASTKQNPESPDQHNKLKKKSGGGGFKKMFGRNKNRDSIQSKPPSAAPANAAAVEKTQGQLQSGGATLGRRFSGFRKKSQQDVSKPSASMTASQAPASIAESEDRTPTQSPEIGAAQHAFGQERSYNPSVQESLSRVDTADAHEARQAFSSFDQGPLEDVPAFAPDASPEASPRHSLHNAAPAPAPTGGKSPAVLAAIEKLEKKNQAAVLTKAPKTPLAAGKGEVGEDGKTVSPVGDRWAQIRKNAAERAAARQSEDQKSAETEGDGGETSGEETIESRVARIKARVAELTGNMENGAPAAGSPRR
ncbi:hypothetical protein VF21_07998 [Pseudogymnoascus sp. 05NY08]|nr:hypothetical protein VF21_07998 [Pseudogymnoascus sp. 05NY08]